MAKLLLIPLDDTVIFPTMDINLPVDASGEERVLLVPRHDGQYAKVGTIAKVADTIRLPGGGRGVSLESEARGVIAGAAEADADGRLRAEVTEHPDTKPVDGRTRELEREYRAVVEEILSERGADERVAAFLRSVAEPGALADTAGYSPDLTFEQKVRLLETVDVTERLALAVELQRERLTELQVRNRIRNDVESGAQKQQREYFLRQQMDSIRRELGEDEVGHRRVPHEDRRGRHARRRARAGRARARPPRARGRAEPGVVDDPHVPRLAHLRAVEQASPTRSSIRSTRVRCSTPTTRAWRTSRTASRSTSPCASCAPSAASRWTRRPARSSP